MNKEIEEIKNKLGVDENYLNKKLKEHRELSKLKLNLETEIKNIKKLLVNVGFYFKIEKYNISSYYVSLLNIDNNDTNFTKYDCGKIRMNNVKHILQILNDEKK